MTLARYLSELDDVLGEPEQKVWFEKFINKVKEGDSLYHELSEQKRSDLLYEFNKDFTTQGIKAGQSEPKGNSLFQGTSISSLTIPYVIKEPLRLPTITELEKIIAKAYIFHHNRLKERVKKAIIEDVSDWINSGLFYVVIISSKLISQTFGLFVDQNEVVRNISGIKVDPHELTSYPLDTREKYYEEMKQRLNLFNGLDISLSELESSLVLADISKPRIGELRNKIILAPVRCNEIACLMSRHITNLIRKKSQGKINPQGLAVVIYDTDTPNTYHYINGWHDFNGAPILPGLTVLGSSGTIDAFRWLYIYRISLLSQEIMKSSLYSQVHSKFMPFVFYGVLVPRDAEILLETENLGRLRYKGNISPRLEYTYLVPQLYKAIGSKPLMSAQEELSERT